MKHLIPLPRTSNSWASSQVKLHALSDSKNECCGIIFLNKEKKVTTVQCQNIHPDPENFFEISTKDLIFAKKNYEVLSLYHSHPKGDCKPSEYDIKNSEESGLPYYIYSVEDDNFFLYKPELSYKRNVLGRIFIEEIDNCAACVIDYLAQKAQVKFNKTPINWIESSSKQKTNNLLLELLNNLSKYSNKTLIKKKGDCKLKPLDLLILKTAAEDLCHVGVITKNNKMLHHSINHLSHEVLITDKLTKSIQRIYRLDV